MRFVSTVVACLLLLGCQTVDVSSSNPPSVVVDRSVARAQSDIVFAFEEIGYYVVARSASRIVMEMELVPNSAERAIHAAASDGLPKAQIIVRFKSVPNGTQITANNDMILNSGQPDQERLSLLDTPDGPRLQRLLNRI